jgi:hypothetical protein
MVIKYENKITNNIFLVEKVVLSDGVEVEKYIERIAVAIKATDAATGYSKIFDGWVMLKNPSEKESSDFTAFEDMKELPQHIKSQCLDWFFDERRRTDIRNIINEEQKKPVAKQGGWTPDSFQNTI